MNWKNFLEKLRQKPEEQKTVILWASVIVCMAVIFVFWLVSLSHSIKAGLNQEIKTPAAASEAASQFEELKNDLPTLWQSLSAGLSSVLSSGGQEIKHEPTSSPSASPNVLPQGTLPVE